MRFINSGGQTGLIAENSDQRADIAPPQIPLCRKYAERRRNASNYSVKRRYLGVGSPKCFTWNKQRGREILLFHVKQCLKAYGRGKRSPRTTCVGRVKVVRRYARLARSDAKIPTIRRSLLYALFVAERKYGISHLIVAACAPKYICDFYYDENLSNRRTRRIL